jgi:hypothetical protein
MKTTQVGYIVQNYGALSKLAESVENPLLLHETRTWVLRDMSAGNTIDVITTPTGKYQAIPVGANNSLSYQYTAITITSPTYTLDFSTLSGCVEITLNINTKLTVLNILKGSKYFIKINFNEYIIENISDILSFPVNISWSYFSTKYNFLLLFITLNNNINSDVLFSDISSTYTSYIDTTTSLIFETDLSSNYVDSSINTLVGTVSGNGNVSFASGALNLAIDNNRIKYIPNSTFDLSGSNVSIECFISFISATDYGSIFSRWSDSEQQFWLRINSTKTILVDINEGNQLISLSYNLTTYLNQTLDYLHILVTKTHNIYKLFLNGVLVDSKKGTTFIYLPSNTNICIGKLENSPGIGDIANTSFTGYIRNIRIAKRIDNNYNFNFLYPKDNYISNVAFLQKNSLLDRKNNISPSVLSTESTSTRLIVDNKRAVSLGNFATSVLDRRHHVEYAYISAYNLTGDVTIEAWIKNTTSNTRGTIIYSGDGTDFNYHLGIYDGNLRIDLNNSVLTLTGNISIINEVWTHIAYVKEGTSHRLYVNSVYAGGATSAISLNTFLNQPLSIKRTPLTNLTEAGLNTSLYPSKSQISIDSIRITKICRYFGTNTSSNFLIPTDFSER